MSVAAPRPGPWRSSGGTTSAPRPPVSGRRLVAERDHARALGEGDEAHEVVLAARVDPALDLGARVLERRVRDAVAHVDEVDGAHLLRRRRAREARQAEREHADEGDAEQRPTGRAARAAGRRASGRSPRGSTARAGRSRASRGEQLVLAAVRAPRRASARRTRRSAGTPRADGNAEASARAGAASAKHPRRSPRAPRPSYRDPPVVGGPLERGQERRGEEQVHPDLAAHADVKPVELARRPCRRRRALSCGAIALSSASSRFAANGDGLSAPLVAGVVRELVEPRAARRGRPRAPRAPATGCVLAVGHLERRRVAAADADRDAPDLARAEAREVLRVLVGEPVDAVEDEERPRDAQRADRSRARRSRARRT